MPGHENDILQTGKTLRQFLAGLGLDGTELLVYGSASDSAPFERRTVGVHLRYWPMWLAMQRGDEAQLRSYFKTKEALRAYYGAADCAGWLECIRSNLRAALAEKPEYLVWHVAECTIEETFTFSFAHGDREVVAAAAEVFNRVADEIPAEVSVLFENLWWPGLRLTDAAAVRDFFGRLAHENTGIMLDTGHLMNTNPELKTQADGVAYIMKTVEALGEARARIRGLHLSCSLSGAYVKSFERRYDKAVSSADLMRHIVQIDQHRPFTEDIVRVLLREIAPQYVVHELGYQDFTDFERKLQVQLAACGVRRLKGEDKRMREVV